MALAVDEFNAIPSKHSKMPKKSGKKGKKSGGKKSGKKSGKKGGKKSAKGSAKAVKGEKIEVDILGQAAMENLYYIAHDAPQALDMRGFGWGGEGGGKKGGKKGKKGKKKKK